MAIFTDITENECIIKRHFRNIDSLSIQCENTLPEDGLSFHRHLTDGVTVLLKICHGSLHILLLLLLVNM